MNTLVKIEWKDPGYDWSWFYLLEKDDDCIRLQIAEYPDGSKKLERKGGRFWADLDEILSMTEVISVETPLGNKFKRGDLVRKRSGSEWQGRVVGEYSTELTPEGYAVESEAHIGSVQIYPAAALELVRQA